MPIRKAHECIRTRRRIYLDQGLKFFNRFLRFSRHEITLTECSVKIGALRSGFESRLQQGNRILEKVLRHAHTRKQKRDVRIIRSDFVRTRQHIECIDWPRLIRIHLAEKIKRIGRIRCQLLCALQNDFGF